MNQWLKKAVLLSFRLNDMSLIGNGPGRGKWWDKVPSKFDGWTAPQIPQGGVSCRAELHRSAIRLTSRRVSY